MRRTWLAIAIVLGGIALGWWLWPRPELDSVSPSVAVPDAPEVAVARAPSEPRAAVPPPRVAVSPGGGEAGVEEAPVYGRVRGAERLPEGAVFVEGCGIRLGGRDVPVDEDGAFFASLQAGRCELRAWRAHGALRIPGPWVSIDPRPGVDLDVELSVPTYEPAGMGIGFEPGEGGVRIANVRPGSPAEQSGLEAGDLITLIDGVATDGMDSDTFLQHGIGESGSRVELQGVTMDDEAFRVVLIRQPIAGR